MSPLELQAELWRKEQEIARTKVKLADLTLIADAELRAAAVRLAGQIRELSRQVAQ